MKRIGVLTSGGDAPGMNAAIRAVVRQALSMGMEVYGIKRGYEGLLEGDIHKMDWRSVGDILQRGGTILRTARSERFKTEEGVNHAVDILKTFEIEGLIVIGGDGSLKGALELSKRGITVMGLPGTIDNDLGYTDYTIGFDTTLNTILDLISKIRDTSSSHDRTSIIEIMGRRCGDLALYAGLAGGADSILVPEVEPDVNAVCRHVLQGHEEGKLHNIILKAEGVDIPTQELADIIQSITGKEARVVIPGHIQRGGTPTGNDRILAAMTGAKAVKLLYDDEPSKAIGICEGEIVAIDLEEALQLKRDFNMDMYNLVNTLS
ncbi:MAG: 6-phosphofructokinase [Eubacterium sp.]|nr:6-phosphofructokinase [Candidatus Colimonas fimequi]